MKTTKRLTSLVLVLAIVMSFCLSVMASDYWWTEYVQKPMEDWTITESGTVESTGSYALFTSDCHRYTYLVKDLLAAANDEIAKEYEGHSSVGLMAFGGDFANEKLVYDDNMSILKAALATSEGTVATYTKGNHEGDVSDEDFEKITGMKRIGETAVNKDGAYYFFNFGAFNGTSQFLEEDISALDTYLADHSDKPAFIVSHYPIHYYNDRRSAKQADKLVDTLNKYPNAIFLWGHNHTEQDPNYGMIRLPGDVIQTGAKADSTKEIKFTYACLGALTGRVNGAAAEIQELNGKLKVVSTGTSGGPGGPPPGETADSFLYLYDGHFNFSAFQSSGVTLYELPMLYKDVATTRWSYDVIYDASMLGLMNGLAADRFDYNGTMTRGMAITVLYRLAGIINGINTDGGTTFQPRENIVREQAAAMLVRLSNAAK